MCKALNSKITTGQFSETSFIRTQEHLPLKSSIGQKLIGDGIGDYGDYKNTHDLIRN